MGTAVLRSCDFLKMPTLSPPIHCGTEGAGEFDSPKQCDSLQSYPAEGKSEIRQGSCSSAGTIQTDPHYMLSLGVHLDPNFCQQGQGSMRHIPPPSCLPSAHSLLWLPSTTRGREHTWMEALMLRGCPSPTTLHKTQVAAASCKLSGHFLHDAIFPDNPPKLWKQETGA